MNEEAQRTKRSRQKCWKNKSKLHFQPHPEAASLLAATLTTSYMTSTPTTPCTMCYDPCLTSYTSVFTFKPAAKRGRTKDEITAHTAEERSEQKTSFSASHVSADVTKLTPPRWTSVEAQLSCENVQKWNEEKKKKTCRLWWCVCFFLLTVNNRSNVAAACRADKNYRKQHSWTSKCDTNTERRRRTRREGEQGTEREREEKTDR